MKKLLLLLLLLLLLWYQSESCTNWLMTFRCKLCLMMLTMNHDTHHELGLERLHRPVNIFRMRQHTTAAETTTAVAPNACQQ
jgi:hypothetical protein